jgi:hypothetical protein
VLPNELNCEKKISAANKSPRSDDQKTWQVLYKMPYYNAISTTKRRPICTMLLVCSSKSICRIFDIENRRCLLLRLNTVVSQHPIQKVSIYSLPNTSLLTSHLFSRPPPQTLISPSVSLPLAHNDYHNAGNIRLNLPSPWHPSEKPFYTFCR